jgi:hypothetical protein
MTGWGIYLSGIYCFLKNHCPNIIEKAPLKSCVSIFWASARVSSEAVAWQPLLLLSAVAFICSMSGTYLCRFSANASTYGLRAWLCERTSSMHARGAWDERRDATEKKEGKERRNAGRKKGTNEGRREEKGKEGREGARQGGKACLCVGGAVCPKKDVHLLCLLCETKSPKLPKSIQASYSTKPCSHALWPLPL